MSRSTPAPHRRASTPTRVDDRLRLEVSDDGVGGADQGGAGLRGLADRVAAVGGDLSVGVAPVAGPR